MEYKLISMSDSGDFLPMSLPNEMVPNFVYVKGISYYRIPQWKMLGLPEGFNVPIDLCIIDSDHNYYTLKRELEYLDNIMAPRCVIAMHDTASKPCKHHLECVGAIYEESNSMWMTDETYLDGTPYPKEDVLATKKVPMMRAIDEFLSEHPDYRKIRHLDECCGCTVISRDFDYMEQIEAIPIEAEGEAVYVK